MIKMWTLLKKDLHLMYTGKLFLTSVITLIMFSLYINYFYADLDTEAPSVGVYDPFHIAGNHDIEKISSLEELLDLVNSGEISIGIDYSEKTPNIYHLDNGSSNNALYASYGAMITEKNFKDADKTIIGNYSREEKNRREMTNEVLFFEIITVSFLGIASLLFKEKSMGVIRVHGIMPVNSTLIILSKAVVFLLSDIIYAFLLILINLGISIPSVSVFARALPHIVILSLIMGLLGYFLALLYRDFKQFAISFSLIIVLMTTPVYLGGNRTTDWGWLDYYPVYHLFASLKNAFFGLQTSGFSYYLFGITIIVCLLILVRWQTKKEIARG